MINGRVTGVLSREDFCVRAFERARDSGVKTICQIPLAYWWVAGY
jgi:hypothetical protein